MKVHCNKINIPNDPIFLTDLRMRADLGQMRTGWVEVQSVQAVLVMITNKF